MSLAERKYCVEDERNARRVLLPAAVNILVSNALENAPGSTDLVDKFHFPDKTPLENLNFCPALTSTWAIFMKAQSALSDAAMLGDIITPKQKDTLIANIDWQAIAPDHHFKANFMTSYPLFALGFVYEMVRAGDVKKPETVTQVLDLVNDPGLDSLLWEGMYTASGVWNQVYHTYPWDVFRNFRHLYDFGSESPFVDNRDGSRSLHPGINNFLHSKMREVNQSGERVAVRCPIAVRSIRGINSDPESPAFLTEEQISALVTPRSEMHDPLATRDDEGGIRIQFDALGALRTFFVGFAQNTVEKFGVPVLVEDRPYPHTKIIKYIDSNEAVPPAIQPLPNSDCPKSDRDDIARRHSLDCSCAA